MDAPDLVDELIAEWRLARPDLDEESLAAMATIGRITRVGLVLPPRLEPVFAEHGLARGEYDVLAALRRLGEPFVATPSEMARLLVLSPGAMTNRLDRLEKAGHVRRAHDPDNRRSVLVTLTAQGRAIVDDALDAHLANEKQLLSTLSAADRRRLDSVLRRLLEMLER